MLDPSHIKVTKFGSKKMTAILDEYNKWLDETEIDISGWELKS